jgi:cobalt-zinc-cadmium efflux system outer membrane protein
VEQQNFAILLRTANNELYAAWRQLSAVVGQQLAPCTLQGDLTQLPSIPEWQEQLDRIIATSPEVAAAVAAVAQAQSALRRACAEPIPDITTQVSVQYDDATDNTITGAQVGIPLPLWNRNQGGIQQAHANVAQASRNVERVQLDLQQRLALAYQQYSNARAQADIYTTQILPKAKETYELVQRGYRLGEIGYLDLLTAQRLYSQTNLAYLDSLSSLWSSWSEIDGLLLTDSLSTASQ